MSKELNIIQAIEMPVGTEFKVVIENFDKECKAVITNDGCASFIYSEQIKENSLDFINAKFIPIQKPVSFMEAVKSNKKIKVIHEEIVNRNFEPLDYLLYYISQNCSDEILRDVILNGKWYIKED